MKKRLLCFFLSLALVAAILPTFYCAADSVESHIPASTLQYLKDKFPNGKYWNHPDGALNNPDGYSSKPCTHHESGICGSYYGSCGCNMFDSAIQCHGFALKLAYECYGYSARNWREVKTIDEIKAGCVVRIITNNNNPHTIFITDVSGDTITYADCNIDHQCGIRWGVRISRSDLKSKLQYMLVSPGNVLPAKPTIYCGTSYYQYDNISASWTAPSDIEGYVVKLAYNGTQVRNFETNNTTYVFEAQAAGTYTLTVEAKNSSGSSSASVNIEVAPHDCASKNYWDVANYADWSHAGIDYAIANGLFNGTSETTFSPNEKMTRGMIATVLWRNADSPSSPGSSRENPFSDVDNGAWYTSAIIWANRNEVMSGIGFGLFAPNATLTREQIVTVLYRYSTYNGITPTGEASLSGFADGSTVSPWAQTAMQWAIANNILQGSTEYGRTYLHPQDGATRAQVATILMRYLQKYVGDATYRPNVVPVD